MCKDHYELRFLSLFKEELERNVSYIAFELCDVEAATRLLNEVETAILKRMDDGPEMFEVVRSRKERKYPYYRIYVRNYVIYYVVYEENGNKVMEVRRFLHAKENRGIKI